MKRIRIKKDFDLQELKKLGFEKARFYDDLYFYKTNNSEPEKYETGLLINPTNAEYENQIVHYTNDEDDNIDLTSELEMLFTLFKMGVIEEFEED